MAATVGTTNFAEYAASTADPLDILNVVVDANCQVFTFVTSHNVNTGGTDVSGVILDPAGANQALTNQINQSDGSFLVRCQLYDRDAPTPGTVTMRIDASGANAKHGAWAVYNLSGLLATFRINQATAAGTGTSASLDPAADDADDITVGGVAVCRGDHDPTQTAGTNICNGEDADNTANDNHTSYAHGYISGSAALTFSWASTANNALAAAAQAYNGALTPTLVQSHYRWRNDDGSLGDHLY